MTAYHEQVRIGVLDWLESVRWQSWKWGRWKYNAHMLRDYGLIPSCGAISILDSFDTLDDVAPRRRRRAAKWLQSTQDSADGFFKDPLVAESDRVSDGPHGWMDIWGQMDARGTLDILDVEPKHSSPRSRFANLAAVNLHKWTLSLDWTDPWLAAERWASAVTAYCKYGAAGLGSGRIVSQAFEIFETEIIAPDTGLPPLRGCRDLAVAMAGLFKTLGAYDIAARPVAHADKAIDATLSLQRDDGEFGSGGDMCINWDAIHVLSVLDRTLSRRYRHDDIVIAGNQLAERLLTAYRQQDGGFAFNREHCLAVHHSVRVSEPLPESDMLGTSMCLRCLKHIDEWNASTD